MKSFVFTDSRNYYTQKKHKIKIKANKCIFNEDEIEWIHQHYNNTNTVLKTFSSQI